MRVSWRVWLGVAVCVAWTALGLYGTLSYGHAYYRYRGFAPPKDPHGVAGGRLPTVHFQSAALRARRSYQIYLPPGYGAAARRGYRFPVLYLLHGSPGGASLFVDAADVGVTLDRLLDAHLVRPFLIVMPNGGDGSFTSDTEWADTPHGRYEGFVLDTVHAVDATWATRPARQFRAIGGNSEGAYGALNIALHHLDTFATVESWSGYYKQRPTGPFKHAGLATVDANSPLLYVPRLAAQLRRLPLHAYVYSGRREREAPRTRPFAAELAAAGGHVTYSVFPGGHNWRLWRDEVPRMLEYANRWFGAG